MYKKLMNPLVMLFAMTALVPDYLGADSIQAQKTSDPQLEKVKTKINKIGVKENITVVLKNGEKYHGFVQRIGDQDFDVAEVDRKTTYTFQFSDVKKVDKGYGAKNIWGKRVGNRGRILGFAVVVGMLVVLPIIAISGS
jgi:hypothetical protein